MDPKGATPIVAAVLDSEEDTAQALEALRRAGVRPDQVSLMMSQQPSAVAPGYDSGAQVAGSAANGATVGGLVGGLAGGLLGLAALVVPGIGPVLGSGILGSLLAGAAVGAAAGGLLGGLMGLGIPEDAARTYERHVREGRTLLTVHPPDTATAQRLRDVLEDSGAYDVRIYEGGLPVAFATPPGRELPEPMLPLPANVAFPAPLAATPPVPSRVASGGSMADRALADPAPAERPGAAATATPYRGAGEAARAADWRTVRDLGGPAGAAPGDRGLAAPAEPAPDQGPHGTDTIYRSGGAGSRGEAS